MQQKTKGPSITWSVAKRKPKTKRSFTPQKQQQEEQQKLRDTLSPDSIDSSKVIDTSYVPCVCAVCSQRSLLSFTYFSSSQRFHQIDADAKSQRDAEMKQSAQLILALQGDSKSKKVSGLWS